ncbi:MULTISPECIES: phosphoribosylformylglycinamidine synthase subunit PurL [unclassified Hyphomicrobium]|uniref:phosphoribosylformylglycinamidine synthase subunit PurL n=1 Tax=unclassified Hyphomicrobium TaxID=2619925 RepID=UPI000213E61F|nr:MULTISPECIES: phosphoribosylformylglycinamidine synthase subunit PurL [unclassified Hyphomicrobium]CCB64653.1 phosphoribosylformylglycinamide synthetase [Hyphomicrobium sp. MC1]
MTETTTTRKITPQIVAEHGLKPDEYERLLEILGREPSICELGIFSVMWSEHCSYKSSRVWLKTLPTSGPQVIQGPGENAGVVDLGDGDAVVFKMESHNHPSYIEPFQGAATGVGGIMRDVFTMGARPVANMNALRFGAPDHAKTRHLVSGVVAGIAHYGNCTGVPTIGGETNFDEGYNNNILVNAMCVGLARTDKIFYSAAKGVGLPVVYVGSKTGRDGIHGATMASAEFDEKSDEKRPTVQVGDPFTEKLLIEACLELMATDSIIAIQDMGAAGLTSSTSEMADKGGVGIELNLDLVPQRETGMTAYEMMLSESQERMLMILKPEREADAKAIFEKWGLDFAVIGHTTDTQRMIIKHKGEVEADLPVPVLANSAPMYTRPHVEPKKPAKILPEWVPAPNAILGTLKDLMAGHHLASRRWIWEQYDHMVMGDTVGRPGGDAGVVRVHGTKKAIAVACDVTPRYVTADPEEGTKQAVVETWRNLTAVGADPLAITDNMNFANPERPEIMGQFVASCRGMAEACNALGYPVVSGNVSLYNETNGVGIPPTPAIGGVGLVPDSAKLADIRLKNEGDVLIVIGREEGHLGQSLYQQYASGKFEGAPPPVNLEDEIKAGRLIRTLIREGRALSVHDCADGGLLVAIAEMALAGGKNGLSREASGLGVELFAYEGKLPAHAVWFGEDQGRYVVEVTPQKAEEVLERARLLELPARIIGRVAGNTIALKGEGALPLSELRSANEGFLPKLMQGELAS